MRLFVPGLPVCRQPHPIRMGQRRWPPRPFANECVLFHPTPPNRRWLRAISAPEIRTRYRRERRVARVDPERLSNPTR